MFLNLKNPFDSVNHSILLTNAIIRPKQHNLFAIRHISLITVDFWRDDAKNQTF